MDLTELTNIDAIGEALFLEKLSDERPIEMSFEKFNEFINKYEDIKSEYFEGKMFVMNSSTRSHEIIVFNIGGALNIQLEENPCRVMASNIKVLLVEGKTYFSPDVIVECDEDTESDTSTHFVRNISLVVEVLSPSTVMKDVTIKLPYYSKMPSLRHILYIAQDRISVQHYHRATQEDKWQFEVHTHPNEILEINTFDANIEIAKIYSKVRF